MSHVFISYSRKDMRYAFRLAGALEYAGWEVWIDEEIEVSEEFPKRIEKAIEESGAVVLLMSPASFVSKWVGQEVWLALQQRKTVLPVLLEGEAHPTFSRVHYEDVRGARPALPSARFFKSLRQIIVPGRRHLRVLIGHGPVAPGEYAVDDHSIQGLAESLVSQEKAVWIDLAPEAGRKALRVTQDIKTPSGETVWAGLYAPNDSRLRVLNEQPDWEDYAGWVEDAAVPDGPLSAGPNPFTLPMLEWCSVPAGETTVGGVTVTTHPFLIGKYPVTNEQYQAFVDSEDGYLDEHWWNYSEESRAHRGGRRLPKAGMFRGPKRPRETVCWYDAVAFCRWLSWKTGLSIFLPSTPQWMRAAQGDDRRLYPWGDETSESTTRCNTIESGIRATTDVDKYPSGAGPFGAFDMSGNVWEWSFTRFGSDDSTDARGDDERLEHGGSWHFDLINCRIPMLNAKSLPGHGDDNIGFRLVCYPAG